MRDDGYGLTLVASEREEKRIELLVVRLDGFDGIFNAFLCIEQSHNISPYVCFGSLRKAGG